MVAAPLFAPEQQYSDSDGNPYAGGTIESYARGTSTPKQTWRDPDQAALQTNPVVLDAAGRAIMYGDGEYRLVLRDSAGNLVWDITASTIVSAAMAPVMLAPTIADAVNLLGLGGGSVSDEAAARAAADSAEQTARTDADNALGTRIDDEVTRATAAEANLQTEIDAITGAVPVDGILPAGYSMRFGTGASDAGGNYSATFSPPFATSCDCVVANSAPNWFVGVTARSAGGFSAQTSSPLHGGSSWNGSQSLEWIAIGH